MLLPLIILVTVSADVVDVTGVKDRLVVMTDGKGHHAAFVPKATFKDLSFVFYSSDGKTFHRQRIPDGTYNDPDKADFNLPFWDPRIAAHHKHFMAMTAGKFGVTCGDRTTELKPLAKADAARLVDGARFETERWVREPYRLLRDDTGIYYYVDKQQAAGKDHRVFMGPRGSLKPLKLKNIVSDSAGDIFATQTGDLRLVVGSDPKWISGKKTTPLTVVPVRDNLTLIYSELGVYSGERLGTPCDDL